MMTKNPEKPQSMPEIQLQEAGTERSYRALLEVSRGLSDKELDLFEEDLSYYTRTGLVGVYMSKFLALLQLDAPATQMQENCAALVAQKQGCQDVWQFAA